MLFLLFTNTSDLLAQRDIYSSDSKKAVKYFLKAQKLYYQKNYHESLKDVSKSLTYDAKFTEALLLQGETYETLEDFQLALDSYLLAYQSDSSFFPTIKIRIGDMYYKLGNYYDAKKYYLSFLSRQKGHPEVLSKAAKKVEQCKFIIHSMENPVDFNPKNLGDSVNTAFDDYIDMISVDESELFITRRSPVELEGQDRLEEDFFYARKIDSLWSKATTYDLPIDAKGNEGAVSLSPDGRYLFFSACHRDDGYGSCDIYFSAKKGDHWSPAFNLGPDINSPGWDSQPSMSADGRTLFFVSNRLGGKGKSDIWYSVLDSNGFFGKPKNLSPKVNTKGNEFTPFIHPDNQTLYFASDGHLGLGESDLFISRKINDSTWSEPENLGYPINTPGSDLKLIVSADGKKGFISTNREEGLGKYDVYQFELYDKIRPKAVSYVKGSVFDSITHQPLMAEFTLIDLESGTRHISSFSDPVNGEFLVCLPSGKNYALQVHKKHYLFYSDNFRLKEGTLEPLRMDIPLQALKSGTSIVLKNVFFDFDSYSLREESFVELNALLELLQLNKSLRIEISGHTDNRGSNSYNKNLSAKRAKAVKEYLTSKGIDANRLQSKGYGADKPIAPNETDKGRALNRRTEILIL